MTANLKKLAENLTILDSENSDIALLEIEGMIRTDPISYEALMRSLVIQSLVGAPVITESRRAGDLTTNVSVYYSSGRPRIAVAVAAIPPEGEDFQKFSEKVMEEVCMAIRSRGWVRLINDISVNGLQMVATDSRFDIE